ncbi:MAG: hydrogenase maturation protease [Verrucomicrobiales bacterium]|nr:hydrogenase maturation protease [Verrucomicrobiales bacterium]
MSEKISILGFGNPARNDDGIGPYVVQQLSEITPAHEGLEIIDMGTSAFEVLFRLKGSTEMVVVDAVVNSGKPEGTLFQLPAEEVEAQVEDDPLVFLHSLKWNQALYYAKNMLEADYPANRITVYLIAVEDIGFGVDLSEPVKAAGDKLIARLRETYMKDAVAHV